MASRFFLFSTALSILLTAPGGPAEPPLAKSAGKPASAPGGAGIFVPNRGQWPRSARFAADFPGARLFLTEEGWILAFRKGSLSFRVPARGKKAIFLPGKRLPGVYNYFLGRDSSRWRTGVPRYDSVVRKGILPGTDLVFLERRGKPAFDLRLEKGADLSLLAVEIGGARSLKIDASGDLILFTPAGPVRLSLPLAWEILPGGKQRPLECRWTVLGPRRAGLTAPGRNPDLALLVVDGSEALTAADHNIAALISDKTALVIINKCDLPAATNAHRLLPDCPHLSVSALTGDGLERLEEAIVESIFAGQVTASDAVLVSSPRHKEALHRALEHVIAAQFTLAQNLPADFVSIDVTAAVNTLGEITGETAHQDMLEAIFSRFCIGK